MKRLTTLLLSAALIVGAVSSSYAIDFKAKGYWSNSYEIATNNKFANKKAGGSNDDEFSAGARMRLQLDALASQALSGTVYFEIGDIYYGQASKKNVPTGGALGADGSIVELKRAYIDWLMPNTDFKLRMGIQGMSLPLFASGGNFVLDDDAAGIVASKPINDQMAVTAMWARLLNDNPLVDDAKFTKYLDGKTYNRDEPDNDAMDFFGLLMPMRFDGLRLTPWVGMLAMGDGIARNPSKDYSESFVSTSRKKFQEGMGVYTGTGKAPMLQEYGGGETYTWWGGLSAKLNKFDPVLIAFDFMYGSKLGNGSTQNVKYMKDNGDTKNLPASYGGLDASRYDRKGWFASLLAEYAFDWGKPGIFGWYSSGDDDNLKNGSERMPAISGNWEYTHTGFKGTLASGAYDGLFAYQPIGLWGVALQVTDVSFIKDLKNSLKILYMRGTNSADMPKKIAESQYRLDLDVEGISPTGAVGSYLTTNDWAMEVNLDTEYKIYDNLKLVLETSYLYVDFDKDTWSYTAPNGANYGRLWAQRPDNPNIFKVGLNFHYTF